MPRATITGIVAANDAPVLLAALAQGAPSVFQPAGPAAERLATIGVYLIVMLTAVCVLVYALLALGAARRRGGAIDDVPEVGVPASIVRRWVIFGGAVFPAAVLAVTLVFILVTLGSAGHHGGDPVDIEVTGHQWWWEVHYPQLGITSANELHIPVDTPVRVRISSADVIHSLWVPELTGKLDLIPGKRNELVLEANRAGVFRGECAEYCGRQHAHMGLYVVAHQPDEMAAWTRAAQQPARTPRDSATAAGARVFASQACGFCHTVRGTAARGTIGPDLTHVGSRRTLAAGMYPTTRASFGGWVANPQRLKPGTLMPPFALSGPELRALAVYLESLQ